MRMASWKEIAEKISDMAPVLGTAIGGPTGGAIGVGVKALAKVFGLSDDASPDEIMEVIKQDPDAMVKLKIAEMDFTARMRGLDIEEQKVEDTPYLEGLKTKTIPWVDALHKMGRQITNYYIITIAFVLMLLGHEITPTEASVLVGGNALYQLIKGKGK